MVSRADRSPFAEWLWTVDRLLVAGFIVLMIGGIVLSFAASPAVAERLGIGPDACFARNPRLVYGRATGWGQDGPMARMAGHDINYIALTGALAAIGPTQGEAVPPLNLVGDFGGGSTDYGRAFEDFQSLAMNDIDHRTTVLILGDARSNYGDPRSDILKLVHARARRVIWLNPEPRSMWNSGDSEMRRLAPYCDRAITCASLQDLERVVSDLLRSAV
mgnify:CR=1 FL=1